MAWSKEQLLAHLDALGITTETTQHAAVFTVEEAKGVRGQSQGAHSKNLFLKDKKGPLFLVTVLEDRPIDLKELRHRIGAKNLSFGKPELLLAVLGLEPGSVSPFGVVNDTENRVQVVIDADMLRRPPLNFHPLTNTATTAIAPDGFLKFLEAAGHPPLIVEF
ncbi:MAG: prolyl-tRNA synthetase associated domain-containing protein [Proteobacteria bacterium]|nr:prolyl-tRNA synthetase associated domain-containing protein [Pseudomonadota bacterium]